MIFKKHFPFGHVGQKSYGKNKKKAHSLEILLILIKTHDFVNMKNKAHSLEICIILIKIHDFLDVKFYSTGPPGGNPG